MEEKQFIANLTPKGLIFIALGGYTAEEEGKNSKENAAKIEQHLIDYLQRNNCLLSSKDGKLSFIENNLK